MVREFLSRSCDLSFRVLPRESILEIGAGCLLVENVSMIILVARRLYRTPIGF